MRLETFCGTNVTQLMGEAQRAFADEAVILEVKQQADGQCRLTAADAEAAAMMAGPGAARSRPRSHPEDAREAIEESAVVPQYPLDPHHTDLVPGILAPSSTAGRPRSGPRCIALVGPTGMGKTTTIAKLATHPQIFGGRQVGLLGLDTYRIGAVDQLRTYAEIARLPVEVIYQADELAAALERLAGCDVVLVDTPGRGPRHRHDANTVREWLTAIEPMETHLVLAAGGQAALNARVLDDYQRFGVTHVLATKLDECPNDWGLFDLAIARQLPMRWVAHGQEVPTDIRSANARLNASAATHGSARVQAGRVA